MQVSCKVKAWFASMLSVLTMASKRSMNILIKINAIKLFLKWLGVMHV